MQMYSMQIQYMLYKYYIFMYIYICFLELKVQQIDNPNCISACVFKRRKSLRFLIYFIYFL